MFLRAFLPVALLACALPTAFAQLSVLNFEVVNAQYDRALDKVVLVTVQPNQLVILDPVTQQVTGSVALPLPPSNVSLTPDGKHAAVGHNAWVSYIDLTKPTLVKTIAVGCDVLQALIGGGDYIYAMPRSDQWTRIFVVQISTGSDVTPSNGSGSFYAGTQGRITSDGNTLYGAQIDISPDVIQRYDISSGIPSYQWQWPYWGDYTTGGYLWLSDDGLRIFTKGGAVVRSSPVQSLDLIYNGTLGQRVQSVAVSLQQDRVFAFPDSTGFCCSTPTQGVLSLYEYQYLQQMGSLILPHVGSNGNTYSYFGKYLFTTNDGNKVVSILQADPNAGLLHDFAIFTMSASAWVVSSASFWIGDVAPNEIVTIFGSNLANGSGTATALPLPLNLEGTSISVTDSAGTTAQTGLYFVSPTQVNFQIPPGAATGAASFSLTVGTSTVATGTLNVRNVAPGIFTATGTGNGPLAGYSIQSTSSGQVTTNAFTFNSTVNQFVTKAMPYSGRGSVYLVAFATGLRGSGKPVTASLNGVPIPVAFSGPQGQFDGLDQVNLGPLPARLPLQQDLQLVIMADGQVSNAALVNLE